MDKLRGRQKKFLENIQNSTLDNIIALDNSRDAGNMIPTLRQMIMELRSPSTNHPLFHCVDMDWRMEGYIFQYSPLLKDEAETTLHTLLPLLQHYNPKAEVESNFHGATLFKCRYME